MDATEAVEKELDKFLTKCGEYQSVTSHQLQECIDQISGIIHELDTSKPDAKLGQVHSILIKSSISKLRETLDKISAEHKDLHPSVSKIGRAIDRNFTTDYSSALPDSDPFKGEKRQLLNAAICEHFLRNGQRGLAETLMNDSGASVELLDGNPFIELNQMLTQLREGNLEPAMTWAEKNREFLQSRNSTLEFKLHQLHFLKLFHNGPSAQKEILAYAKVLGHFAGSHACEIQRLMGALIFLPTGLEGSPYCDLLDPANVEDACNALTKDVCQLQGLPVNSPLAVAVDTGCKALPPLLSIKSVMQNHLADVISGKDELPVEIDLGPEYRFHSQFACPILRQQTTKANPPVRLNCGHAISRDALNKLIIASRVKCPYCPEEQAVSQTKELHF